MFGDQICLSALLTARGAPPPLARAPALEDSLSSRGPQALLTARGAPPSLVYVLRPDSETCGHSLGHVPLDEFGSRLRRHVDRMTRALLEARRAPGAQVELDPVEPPFSQFHDGLLGTCGVAVVALETIAARQASGRLVPSLFFREP